MFSLMLTVTFSAGLSVCMGLRVAGTSSANPSSGTYNANDGSRNVRVGPICRASRPMTERARCLDRVQQVYGNLQCRMLRKDFSTWKHGKTQRCERSVAMCMRDGGEAVVSAQYDDKVMRRDAYEGVPSTGFRNLGRAHEQNRVFVVRQIEREDIPVDVGHVVHRSR